MAFKPGDKKPAKSGRKKGGLNKKTLMAQELCAKLGVDPLEVLLNIVKNDWKALGYDKPTETKYSQFGTPYESPLIDLKMRLWAASQAVDYVQPKLRSIEHTGKDGAELANQTLVLETTWREVKTEDEGST